MVNEATISDEKGPLRRTDVNRGDCLHRVTRGAGVQLEGIEWYPVCLRANRTSIMKPFRIRFFSG